MANNGNYINIYLCFAHFFGELLGKILDTVEIWALDV
jgi:hypothetical protein